MQLRRARFLSSERRMYQGACLVSVALNIMSRAREYSNHLVREGRSIGLSFHWRSGSFDARLETALLLLVAGLQPDFDELDAALDDVFLDLGAEFEKAGVLLLRAKAHHILHASAVIPTAVENDDLTRRREMRHVTLHIHLRLLAIGRRRQRDRAKHAGADSLGQGANGAAFARGVAALEDDDHAQALVFDPLLEMAQLGLELAKFLLVVLGVHFLRTIWF